VKITTKTKKIIDIEIQVKPVSELRERIVFYTAKMVTEQVGKGDNHSKIKRVISIIITDYRMIADSAKYHHRFVLYDPETKVEFTDIIEVNTLELTKLPEAGDGTELWNWLKFLSAERKEDLEMIAERSPQVKRAVVRLLELSSDERTRLLYESRQKMEWDNQAREQGARDEGRNEGRNERNIEIAKNLLKMNISIEHIIASTGLTRNEVEKLNNAN